jgi:hypothetical protein
MATTVFTGFTSGDYNSSNVGVNNFWLDTNSNTYTQDFYSSTTSITANFTLNHGGSGTQFSGGWNLRTFLRATYALNGVSQTKYFVSDAVRSYTATMTNGTQYSLGSGTVSIPHNSDGTFPAVTITGYCSHWTSGTGAYPGVGGTTDTTPTYVPGITSAAITITAIPGIYTGKRFDGASWVGLTTRKRFDGTNWVTLTSRTRYDGDYWSNISN